MPGTPTSYPPAAPQINGNLLSIDLLLKQPARIQKRVASMLLERLVAGYIFADGPAAPGGAVIYDRVLASDLYTTRDVQDIEPGSEFPIVDDEETSPQVAATVKRGGMVFITDEAVRRNQIDVLNRKLVRLTNTMARKIDTVSMAVLDSDPVVPVSNGTSWADAVNGDPIDDIATRVSRIENLDLGYKADTVLINPAQELALFRRKDIRAALPRENAATNPLLSGRINGLLGLNWVVTNRVAPGSVYVMQAKMAGSLCDELPLYTRVIDDRKSEVQWLQAARVCVPVVTDPLAVQRITNVA